MHLPIFLVEFFTSLKNQENESLKRTFEGDFSSVGEFTILCQKFIENDEALIKQVLPKFKEYLESETHQNLLLSVKKDAIKKELDALYQMLGDNPSVFYESQIEHSKKELSKLSISSLRETAGFIFDETISKIETVKNNPNILTSNNYFYTHALKILYEKFNSDVADDIKYKKPQKEENKLYRYYQSLDIDLKCTDCQFNKYDLLSVSSSDEIIVGLPSRIFDKKNNAQFLVDIPEHLLNIFMSLLNSSIIKKISFLVDSEVVFETNKQYFILLGSYQPNSPVTFPDFRRDNRDRAVERHIIKTPENINTFPAYISVGRFIENTDSAWYFIDNYNIYLEEIIGDFKILDDCVVTQLVHIEYYTADKTIYLSHVDHEYIFYSYDEFDIRQKDFSQKGSARKRIKTFKIDSSDIPMITDGNVLVLNTILDSYFKKPYLLNGFIREIISKKG